MQSSRAASAQSPSSESSDTPEPFELCREGRRLILRTSRGSVRRAQMVTRLLCGICALTGVGLLAATPWGSLLAGASVAAAFLVPGFIRVQDLVEVDETAGMLRVRQATAAAGAELPLAAIREVRGEYEVRGWDPQTGFQAVLQSGERVTLLVLPGTNDKLTREAGLFLAELTACPVSYTGPDDQGWQLQA